MKIKPILILILMLISTNLFTFYTTKNFHAATLEQSKIHLYELEGDGEKWKVENYHLIISLQSVRECSVELVHKENSKIKYLKVEIKLDNELIYANINTGMGETIQNINKYTMSSFEKDIDRDKLSKLNVTIIWKDSTGKTSKEVVNLKVTNDIIV
ncbi:hypothetical protein PCCS19_02350 [Paenibacillus sp. CCS19]|uniref:hypothetical protein n=1 Tax=Paenibacillus sp. CCS19 TaxID=3158387 RepID=UPI00256C5D4C|nr:hypothetical protein [Paenibacillus cellulosilyticus]GMK37182.1 hypothetical protein PCCS19_02350 [Paenibacillus cellulosilyticus]